MDPVSKPEVTPGDSKALERELQVQQVVGALKNLADLTDGGRDRRAVLERVGSRLMAATVRANKQYDAHTKTAATNQPRTPVALAVYCEKHLGHDWTEYEPEILIERLGLDGQSLSALLAAKLAFHRSTPYTEWEVFAWVAQAFNGLPVTPETMPEFEPAELAWAADELRLIDPVTPWSTEVGAFVAACLHQAGIVQAPKELQFCQATLNTLLSDHGLEVQHALTQLPLTEAAKVQRERLDAIAAYVNVRHNQAVKELEAL